MQPAPSSAILRNVAAVFCGSVPLSSVSSFTELREPDSSIASSIRSIASLAALSADAPNSLERSRERHRVADHDLGRPAGGGRLLRLLLVLAPAAGGERQRGEGGRAADRCRWRRLISGSTAPRAGRPRPRFRGSTRRHSLIRPSSIRNSVCAVPPTPCPQVPGPGRSVSLKVASVSSPSSVASTSSAPHGSDSLNRRASARALDLERDAVLGDARDRRSTPPRRRCRPRSAAAPIRRSPSPPRDRHRPGSSSVVRRRRRRRRSTDAAEQREAASDAARWWVRRAIGAES